MPKRARGDPIEYVRNVRLRAVRQFWDWLRRMINTRRLGHEFFQRGWMYFPQGGRSFPHVTDDEDSIIVRLQLRHNRNETYYIGEDWGAFEVSLYDIFPWYIRGRHRSYRHPL